MSHHLLLLQTYQWSTFTAPGITIWLSGRCLIGDKGVAAEHFKSIETLEQLTKKLQHANGFFSLVIERGAQIFAAVDHVRSLPLFYMEENGAVVLSDQAEILRRRIAHVRIDDFAKQEFLKTGFTTGRNTLLAGIKQVQAAEVIKLRSDGDTVSDRSASHYEFLHVEPDQFDEEAQAKLLDAATDSCIRRLIAHANGRQIAIPLSGGFDSKLIAMKLKQFGYENIVAFTYGLRGNKDAIKSETVAKQLGISWRRIEYTPEKWKQGWNTELRRKISEACSNWSSLAHMQDWIAIKDLVDEGHIAPDAVIAPGHSGDFVAGSHLPSYLRKDKAETMRGAITTIASVHYHDAQPSEAIASRIAAHMGVTDIANGVDFANAFEFWDWRERQAKYICNSVSPYRTLGLAWWMPLWDKEFVDFWKNVPLDRRLGRVWYRKFVSEAFARFTNTPVDWDNGGELYWFPIANKMPKKLRNFARALYRSIRSRSGIPFGSILVQHIDADVLARLERQGRSVHEVLSQQALDDFEHLISSERSSNPVRGSDGMK
jgi:asparagine synthase (glutamine-hydrolysing)